MKEAILHKGFAFVDILQPCIVFHNTTEMIWKNAYKIKTPENFEEAYKLALEWDYNLRGAYKIPLGIFWKEERETFEEKEGIGEVFWKRKKETNLKEVLENHVV